MSKVLKHEENIEQKGNKFKATLIKEEELTGFEFLSIRESVKNTIMNLKDRIKANNDQIQRTQKENKNHQEHIEELEKRLKDTLNPQLRAAKTMLTEEEKKKYDDLQKQIQEREKARDELIQAYGKAKKLEKKEQQAS